MKRVMGVIFHICVYAFFNVIINLGSIWVKKCTFVIIDLIK